MNAGERHREGSSRGGRAWADKRRTLKAAGMAAAIAWRESRRCKAPVVGGICGALAWQSCAHRLEGLFGGDQGCPST